MVGLMAAMISCAVQAPPSPTADADFISTSVHETVYAPLTLTAAAPTLTPSPTLPPLPTETIIPNPTSDTPIRRPFTTEFAGCWTGPGSQYTLISNISPKKYVELIGVGDTPGWYVIRNPYFHNPCWIEAIYLKFDDRMDPSDTSKYPVMTPKP